MKIPNITTPHNPLRDKYTNIDWCRLIAFLINCFSIKNYHITQLEELTVKDIWESNPNGELCFVLLGIDNLSLIMADIPSSDFKEQCFKILEGKNVKPSHKYATTLGLELYLNIFPTTKSKREQLQKQINELNNTYAK